MTKIENHCVDCQIYCNSQQCSLKSVPVKYCDDCGAAAEYEIEGYDYCKECAEKLLAKEFIESNSIYSAAEQLGMVVSKIW